MGKRLKLILFVLLPIICLVIAGIPFTLADYPETQIEQTMTGTSAEDTGASTADKSMKGGALYISGGASYTMTGGSITGKDNQYGGAVYVTNGSTFTMTGGTITGCTALYGGAIYVEAGGTCNITGGTITGNKAQFAPAIYVEDGGVLNVDQTAVIKDNEYEKYGNLLEVYVDGSLVQSRYIKADTYTIDENEMPLDYEHCCGYFLDERLSECSNGEIALTSEAMGFAPRTADAEDYVARLYTRTANPDNFNFSFNGTTQTYDIKKKSTSISGHIVFPKEYKDVQTSIYSTTGYTNGAFYGCSSMTGITFQEGLKTIGGCAFYGMSSLTGELVIPDSVTEIKSDVFTLCRGLTGDLILPNSVETIGQSAFYECSGFSGNLVISENTTRIEKYSFFKCSNFTGDIIIPDKVTYIGASAFYDCRGFAGNIIIGNSVTSIGYSAFYNCSGIKGSLIIPDSVTSIESNAFSDCTGITGSLIIPDSMTDIGNSAFSHCSGIKGTLTIGKNVANIGTYAFAWCGLTGNIIIPDSVIIIGSNAFYECRGFDGSLTIGKSVETIGSYAFGYCQALTGDVIIPDSVTSIGDYAFNYCFGLNGRLVIGNSVTTIGRYAFNATRNFIGSLTIPDSVVEIGELAFDECQFTGILSIGKSLSSVSSRAFGYLSKTIEDIDVNSENQYLSGEKSALVELATGRLIIGCNNTNISVLQDVTSIDAYAFYSCYNLTGELSFNENLTSIGSRAFSGCRGLTGRIVIPEGVTIIGSSTFSNCSGLTGELVLPEGVTSIGDSAFYNCTGLTGELVIPKSVTGIGKSAFNNCTGFTGTLVIPSSLKTINSTIIKGCTGITKVHLPSTVTTISASSYSSSPFYQCSSSLVIYTDVADVSSKPTSWGTYWNYYDSVNQLEVVWGCDVDSDGNIVIPTNDINIYVDGATTPTKTLSFDFSVTSYTMVESDMPLDYESCCGYFLDSELRTTIKNDTIDFSNGDVNLYTRTATDSSYFTFEKNTTTGFYDIVGTTIESGDVVLPKEYQGVQVSIGITDVMCEPGVNEPVFYEKNISSIILPSGLTELINSVFYCCNLIGGELIIPDSVTSIGDSAFYYCRGLTGSLIIPDSVISIGERAFSSCSGLTSVIIPDSVTSIGDDAFYYCSGLTSVIIGNSVTSIGISAFSYCTGLTSVYIPSTVTTITALYYYSAPFSECSSSLVIYTDVANASSVPSGWSTYWNYYGDGLTLTVNYGYTLEQYKSAVGLEFAPMDGNFSGVDAEILESVQTQKSFDSLEFADTKVIAVLNDNKKVVSLEKKKA